MEILIMLAYCKAPANSLTNVKYKTAWWLKKKQKALFMGGCVGISRRNKSSPN